MKYGQHYYSVITADMRAYVLFLIDELGMYVLNRRMFQRGKR